MRTILASVSLCLAISGCLPEDESVSGYIEGSHQFTLATMNGEPVDTAITLDLSEAGTIRGIAPCNQYTSSQTAPYPWIAVGPIVATRKTCPDLALETQYFRLLEAMTIAEISGPVLILTNEDGAELVFQASP